MAKLKETSAEVNTGVENEQIENTVEDTKPTEESAPESEVGSEEEADDKEDGEKSSKTAKKSEAISDVDKMPAMAVKVLKLFTNYEKLYIDATGGAFTEGTKLPENNTAILYQNPYYKK